jgi:hypothetical protein
MVEKNSCVSANPTDPNFSAIFGHALLKSDSCNAVPTI